MLIKTISCFLLSSALLTLSASTSLAEVAHSLNEATVFQFNPSDEGVPTNTTGGASRNPDECYQQDAVNSASGITFLTPQSFVGLTASEKPEFLIYANNTLAQQLFINVQDETGETIYQGFQALSEDTGFITVSLPSDAPNLVADSVYRLSIVPVCEGTLRPDSPAIVGYVQLVNLPQDDVSSQNSPFELAQQYAEVGIWYDTLSLLQEELNVNPTDRDLNNAWGILLESADLADSVPNFNAQEI